MRDDSLLKKLRQLALAMMLALVALAMVWGHFQLELFP